MALNIRRRQGLSIALDIHPQHTSMEGSLMRDGSHHETKFGLC